MLVDALAHLNDPRISSLGDVLNRARLAGVSTIVSAGTDPLAEPELVGAIPDGLRIKRAFGIHPAAADAASLRAQLDALGCLLDQEDVVAIGELGLDRRAGMPPIEVQLPTMRAQLALARERELPIILHGVHAVGLILAELSHIKQLPAGGIWHGFTGPAEILPQLAHLNLSVSLGSLVTHPKASRCHRVARTVELGQLVVESDCPDHPTAQSEHGIGEPSLLPEIIAAIASHREEAEDAIAAATVRNAARIFRLD